MGPPSRIGFRGLAALALATAVLYLGKPLLMPLALALLVSFCLAPLVRRLERIGLGRLPAAIAVILLLASLLGGAGWLVARETGQLAASLPEYRANLRSKIHALRGPVRSITGAAESLDDLGRELQPPSGEQPAPKVEVVDPGVVGKAAGVLGSALDLFGVAGIVAVLALFVLLEREELRDRLIWLTGEREITLTTHALGDVERRVSRYLGAQSILCALHGVGVGVGLLWIGLPGAVVWGALAALLRFLPYFGPWIAALLPIALSLAAFPGWDAIWLTAGLFIALELVSNNLLEPWLYGSRTGLSPFGVIFSAFFWAWLWGIPGLLLATPLSVCLVVVGRYVRELEFLSVLLGDQPALAAEIRFYQRLLALDLVEADEVLRAAARGTNLEELSDRLVLPVLRRLAEDEERELISEERGAEVRRRLAEILDELLEVREAESAHALAGVRVCFVPAHGACDAVAGRWLASAMARQGATATLAPEGAPVGETVERIAADSPEVVCVSAMTPASVPSARLLCARFARLLQAPEVIAGCWAAQEHPAPPRTPSAPARGIAWITRAAELKALLRGSRAPQASAPATSRAGGASFDWGMGRG